MNVDRKMWLTRATDLGIVTFGVAAVALLLSGCGGDRSAKKVASTSTSGPAIESSSPVASAAMPASAGPMTGAAAAVSQGSTSNAVAEGLPPEIAFAQIETQVTPGQVVEVTVYGTPDVTEMSLWDGRGDRVAMLHDEARDVWTAKYRVPIRPREPRVGLSVTARNESSRWRRVWLFLEVAPVGAPTTSAPDSSEVEEGC